MSCLCCILGADLLISARAMVFNPHFRYFFSPDVRDSELGSVQFWPAGSALLPLDQLRELKSWIKLRITRAWYGFYVRINTQSQWFRTYYLFAIISLGLVALLPPKSLVLHPMSCWQDSRQDSNPARFFSQLWQMRAFATDPAAPPPHFDVQSCLGWWQQRKNDFHLVPTYTLLHNHKLAIL